MKMTFKKFPLQKHKSKLIKLWQKQNKPSNYEKNSF